MCVAACSEWSECASRVSTGGQRALRAAGHRPPRTENPPTDQPELRNSGGKKPVGNRPRKPSRVQAAVCDSAGHFCQREPSSPATGPSFENGLHYGR